MKLVELSNYLKEAAQKIDSLMLDAELLCGMQEAEKYVKENKLEYIESEIKNAFHAGFVFARRQSDLGKFAE